MIRKTSKIKKVIFSVMGLIMLFSTICSGESDARTYYMSPNGSDSNDGSINAPWFTFSHGVHRLQPGDTLILKDGIYTKSTTGLPYIDCSSNADNGTASSPITIRAENERQAFLKSDGSVSAFNMDQCSHWIVDGLRGQSVDLPESRGGKQRGVFEVDYSDHITLRRLFGSHDNRYFNNHIYAILNDNDILIEECEAYYFHRHGFSIWKSHDVTIRRSYANSRGYADLPDGRYSGWKSGGDEAYVFYQTSSSIVENAISEDRNGGFQVHGGTTFDGLPGGHDNRILGSISLNDFHGVHVDARNGGSTPAVNNLYENFLVVGAQGTNSIYLRSATDTKLKNITVLNASPHSGIGADQRSDIPCNIVPGGCSFSATNVLSTNNAKYGFISKEQKQWVIEHSNAYANGIADYSPSENISDDSGHIRDSLSVAPANIGLGENQCIVYIPENSNMKGAGKNGEDIGANILYRYENGILTDQPLWNPDSGAFPCGAIVPGINDVPGRSCFDVHKRLNVNNNGCPLPYSDDGGSNQTPSPSPDPEPEPDPEPKPNPGHGNTSAYFTSTPITVDGLLSEEPWQQAGFVTFSNPSRSDNLIEVLTLWDENYLYFACEVRDDHFEAQNQRLWQDDGVEIYLDTLNNKSTSMDSNDYHFMININDLADPAGIDVKTHQTADGYTMEIAIPWDLINTIPEQGKVMGLLLGNNDRDNDTSIQFDWLDLIETGYYARPHLWGNVLFSGEMAAGCTGDLNADDRIDVADLQLIILIILGASVDNSFSDLNNDGVVNIIDLQALINQILKGSCV